MSLAILSILIPFIDLFKRLWFSNWSNFFTTLATELLIEFPFKPFDDAGDLSKNNYIHVKKSKIFRLYENMY